jgi:Outer membrane protein beta-barrel domain
MRAVSLRAGRVAVMCTVAMVAVASAAGAQGLGFGVKGGVILADLHEDDNGQTTPFDFRTGLVAGGFVTWPLGSRLEIQPEVLFTQKGAKVEQGGGTLTQKLDYVDVPVLASYRIFGAPGRHLAVFAGPAFGVRVRAKSSASFSGGSTVEDDVSDQVARTDLAIVGGAAYHRGRLVVDGRYSWGFSDIDQDKSDDVKIRNRGISFLAGWRF